MLILSYLDWIEKNYHYGAFTNTGTDVAADAYLNIFTLQSSVCEKIMELLGQNKIDHHQRQVAILSQDSFYKVLTPEQKAKALKGQFNFDHPGIKTLK